MAKNQTQAIKSLFPTTLRVATDARASLIASLRGMRGWLRQLLNQNEKVITAVDSNYYKVSLKKIKKKKKAAQLSLLFWGFLLTLVEPWLNQPWSG